MQHHNKPLASWCTTTCLLSFLPLPGKCSHGGEADLSSTTLPRGGIHKDELRSDNAGFHNAAVNVATAASLQLLEDIRLTVGNNDFLRWKRHIKNPLFKNSTFSLCYQQLEICGVVCFCVSNILTVVVGVFCCWCCFVHLMSFYFDITDWWGSPVLLWCVLSLIIRAVCRMTLKKPEKLCTKSLTAKKEHKMSHQSTFWSPSMTHVRGPHIVQTLTTVICNHCGRTACHHKCICKWGFHENEKLVSIIHSCAFYKDFGPLFRTTHPDKMKIEISKIKASGGGDFPEMCFSGLQVLKKNCMLR